MFGGLADEAQGWWCSGGRRALKDRTRRSSSGPSRGARGGGGWSSASPSPENPPIYVGNLDRV